MTAIPLLGLYTLFQGQCGLNNFTQQRNGNGMNGYLHVHLVMHSNDNGTTLEDRTLVLDPFLVLCSFGLCLQRLRRTPSFVGISWELQHTFVARKSLA